MEKHKLKSLICLGMGVFWASIIHGQESVNSSGGDITSNNGQVLYSVGQVFYTSHENSSGTIVQGIQHTYEITSVGINEPSLDIDVSVFPNPATDHLTLEIRDFGIKPLKYALYNMQGVLIKSDQITSQSTIINMNALSPAAYLLQITNQKNHLVKSYKIIKN